VGSAAVARATKPVAFGRHPAKDAEIFLGPFRRYMKAIGWDEGRNIRFMTVFAEDRNDRGWPASSSGKMSMSRAYARGRICGWSRPTWLRPLSRPISRSSMASSFPHITTAQPLGRRLLNQYVAVEAPRRG